MATANPTCRQTGFRGISPFFHYLHHRYFECNYGDPIIPYDRWFGTFHHGTPEAHARMQERWADKRA